MRKAVFDIENYTVREAPTGGWLVYPRGAKFNEDQPISRHEDRQGAIDAVRRYIAADVRRRRPAA